MRGAAHRAEGEKFGRSQGDRKLASASVQDFYSMGQMHDGVLLSVVVLTE